MKTLSIATTLWLLLVIARALPDQRVVLRNKLDPDNVQQSSGVDSTDYCAVTCLYVRPNGSTYGTGSGNSWTNAISGFSGITWSSVACGTTIWVSAGTYTQSLQPAKSCTSTTRISMRRARADTATVTGVAGYTGALVGTITQGTSGSTTFNTGANFITISGYTGTGDTCGTYLGTCGWVLSRAATTEGSGIDWPNGSTSDGIIVEYMEIVGPGIVTYTNDGRGIDATSFTSQTNGNTISHCKVHGWESTFYTAQDNFTIEYTEIYAVNAANPGTFHPNAVYITDSPNIVLRYNILHDKIGEGFFWTNNDVNVTNAFVYGNMCIDINQDTDKCFQPDNTGTFTGMKLYNNLCENFGASNQCFANSGPTFASSEARNNIWSRANGLDLTGLTQSNNLTTSSSGVFIDRASHDFHIVSTTGAGFARDAGISLGSPYNKDRDGNTRGADGAWDIGPYEFISSPDPQPLLEKILGYYR